MLHEDVPLALTFEDVLLVPRASSVLPRDVTLTTELWEGQELTIPIISSAMDTVTEADMAIAMARIGGLGVVHKNMSIRAQAAEVRKVKRATTVTVSDPVVVAPEDTLLQARTAMRKHNITGVPVVVDSRAVGILTNRDLRFERNLEQSVSAVMSTDLITVPPGTNIERAKELLQAHKIEKLLVVNGDGLLCGLITIKDIDNIDRYPDAFRDAEGHLVCGAAVGVGVDCVERATALVQAGADLLVVDTAHGHSSLVLERTRWFRSEFPDVRLVVGNVATGEATLACIEAGADIVKVGIGPGSICTTRVVAGVGVPQLSAIAACSRVAHANNRKIIADGGVKYSGDIAKAFAAGADAVMIGSLLAGTDEAPGQTVLYQGRRYKSYRGMGSLEAMASGSSDRYFQEEANAPEESGTPKLVPEGIVGRVPYRGPVTEVVHQLTGGVRSAMGYCGCKTLVEMQREARFVRITQAGLRESHVHDVIITHEAPNYRQQ